MTKRYALRDDQWARIEKYLPGRADTPGVTANDNRLFVDAVPAFLGEICPSVLGTGPLPLNAIAAGRRGASGNRF